MGGSQSHDEITNRFSFRLDQFQHSKIIKCSIGDLQVVKEPNQGQMFVVMPIYYDTDYVFKRLVRALDDIEKSQAAGPDRYIKVVAADISDRRLICSASSFTVVLNFFQLNLEDVIRAGYFDYYFPDESRVWALMFSLVKTIHLNSQFKVEGNFFHPRSICWLEDIQSWSLLHPAFFPEMNNYSEAVANNFHFASPELFAQASSGRRRFTLHDQNRSDMFSVGLIVLYLLYKGNAEFDFDRVFNRSQFIVDGLYLQRLVNDLEKRNISELMIRIVGDMIQELEHLRIDSNHFLSVLERDQENLENENFRDHEKILENFIELKSSQILMSVNKNFIGNEESSRIIRQSTVLERRRASINTTRKAVPTSRQDRPAFI